MAIIVGDSTDGVRTGLAGRIANAIVAVFTTVTYPAGANHQKGLNALVQGVVDAFNNDGVDPFSQLASSLPMLSATSSSGQSIPNNTSTIAVFGTVERDSDGAYNSGTGRFTVPTGKGGDYLVTAQIVWNTAPAVGAQMSIAKNAANLRSTFVDVNVAGAPESITAVLNLAAGDVVDIRLLQASGSAVALQAFSDRNFIGIKCLSRT